MTIMLAADSAEHEMTILKATALATAIKGQMRVFESEVWALDGIRVQVVVKRERHRGREAYYCRWRLVGGRRKGIGENGLRYCLRRLASAHQGSKP